MPTITINIPSGKGGRIADAFTKTYSGEFVQFLNEQDPPVEIQDATAAHKKDFITRKLKSFIKEVTIGHEVQEAAITARQAKNAELDQFRSEDIEEGEQQ